MVPLRGNVLESSGQCLCRQCSRNYQHSRPLKRFLIAAVTRRNNLDSHGCHCNVTAWNRPFSVYFANVREIFFPPPQKKGPRLPQSRDGTAWVVMGASTAIHWDRPLNAFFAGAREISTKKNGSRLPQSRDRTTRSVIGTLRGNTLGSSTQCVGRWCSRNPPPPKKNLDCRSMLVVWNRPLSAYFDNFPGIRKNRAKKRGQISALTRWNNLDCQWCCGAVIVWNQQRSAYFDNVRKIRNIRAQKRAVTRRDNFGMSMVPLRVTSWNRMLETFRQCSRNYHHSRPLKRVQIAVITRSVNLDSRGCHCLVTSWNRPRSSYFRQCFRSSYFPQVDCT